MKKTAIYIALGLLLLVALYFGLTHLDAKWSGVDETVIEKFAAAAGREPWPPLINTDQGDLLLFFFLIAGTVGGFVAGYHFRELFPPNPRKAE